MKIGELNGHRGIVLLPGFKQAEVALRPDKQSDSSYAYIMETADKTPVGWFKPEGDGYAGCINGAKAQIIAGRNGSGVYLA